MKSWIQHLAWAVAFGGALVFVLHSVPLQADEVSDIGGVEEAPTLRRILDCFALNAESVALLEGVDDKSKLDSETNATVRAKIDEALTCATEALQMIQTEEQTASFQSNTEADFAFDALNSAISEYLKIRDKLAKPQKAKKVRQAIAKAEANLLAAKFSLQGIFVEDKEKLTALQGEYPLEAYVEDFDRASIRAVIKLIEPADLGALSVGPNGKKAKVKKKAAKKKVRRKSSGKGKKADRDDAEGGTRKRKKSDKDDARKKKAPSEFLAPGAKANKPPTDYYLAFTAESKKQTEGGFFVMSFERAMRGPFRAGATLGALDSSKIDPTGTAFACMEFDITGSSSPLEFVTICARPTGGDVQVFASRTGGTSLGQTVVNGVSVVDVAFDYDGTTFQLSAKAEGAPDSAFVQFGTFTRAQGNDTWTPFVGGVGLTGKAEIGVDRVFITPR